MDSGPTSPPKDTGEEEARAPLSPSPRKRRRWTAHGVVSSLFAVSFPPYPPFSSLFASYNWIAGRRDDMRNIHLSTNQKGDDHSETTVEKLSARSIQIFRVHFSVINVWPLSFDTCESTARTKMYPADLDSLRRIINLAFEPKIDVLASRTRSTSVILVHRKPLSKKQKNDVLYYLQ